MTGTAGDELDRLRAAAPPAGLAARGHRWREMAFDDLQDADFLEVVRAQVKKAKTGDTHAARFVTAFYTPRDQIQQQPAPPAATVGVYVAGPAESPRLVTAEGPAPLGDGGLGLLRRLFAQHLALNGGAADVANLAVLAAVDTAAVESAVAGCDWFSKAPGDRVVRLAPAGRAAVA